MASRRFCCPWATKHTTTHIRLSYGFLPILTAYTTSPYIDEVFLL